MSDSPPLDPENDARHSSSKARPEEDAQRPSRRVPGWVESLASRAREADGAPPFSDQALVDYRLGLRELLAINKDVAAIATAPEALEGHEAEFVVDPGSRGQGLGTRMLEKLLSDGVRLIWAHGDHPAARALAASHQLSAVRTLLHLDGRVSTPDRTDGRVAPQSEADRDHPRVLDTFRVGEDEDEWVALNARTFADHPEQGRVTRIDVEQLETEPWFSADNFLVLREEMLANTPHSDGRMIGYCWLKVEDGPDGDRRGEFYVVGVAPDHQGEHLGATLFDAGLARLADLGIRDAHLYVEADNGPALRLYHSRGFVQDAIDVQYSSTRLI
jgi:mycothiol synthase